MHYLSFFESGTVIFTQENKQILIFKNEPGLIEEIESQGFDVDEIQYLMNLAGENHDGISWDLMPAGNSV